MLLRSRDSNVRDVTRATLVQIAGVLDQSYFPMMIKELADCLPERMGVQPHVLAYTAHALVVAFMKKSVGVHVRVSASSVNPEDAAKKFNEDERKRAAELSALEELDSLSKANSTDVEKDKEDDTDMLIEDGVVAPLDKTELGDGDNDNGKALLPNSFDATLPSLIGIMMDDIFGETAKAKVTGARGGGSSGNGGYKSRAKEAKAQRSYDTFEILASMLTFLPHTESLHTLLGPIFDKLKVEENDKIIRKVEEVFRRICSGLSKNPSVRVPEMMIYAHTLMCAAGSSDNTLKTKGMQETSGDIADAASKPKPKPKGTKVVSQWLMADTGGFKPGRKITKREGARVIMKAKLAGLDRHRSKRVEKGGGGSMESVFKANSHCVATFSLQLLWSQMKLSQAKKGRKALENTPKITLDRRVLSPHNKTHREMLDPFVGLCVSWAKKGASDDVVLLALQCVGAMLVWGSHHPGGTLEALPSMKVHIDKFVANLFGLLEMCAVSSSTSNIKIQAIFRLMTLILRECPYCKLNKAQLSVLVSFVRQDMTEIEHQQATFALLKAIVFRGFVSVEVYDLMQKVLELMIQSHRHTVRTLCSQVFVAFLMSYPLTNTKRETHLRKLLQCLDYDYAEGRLAALECVHGLLLKLPAPVIEENTQMLFLALVLRLVNDEDQKCRLSTSVVLKVLTRRTSTAECQKCVGVVLQWNGDDGKNQNLILRKAAAQVIGLVIESRKDVFRKNASEIFLSFDASLKDVLHQRMGFDGSFSTDAESSQGQKLTQLWQLAYHILMALEKIATTLPGFFAATLGSLSQDNATATFPVIGNLAKALEFPHSWVQLAASRLLGTLLALNGVTTAKWKIKENGDTLGESFLEQGGVLSDFLCSSLVQLQSLDRDEALGTQVVKNLLFFSSIMHHRPDLCKSKLELNAAENTGSSGDGESISLGWLCGKIEMLSKKKGDVRRVAVFKWIAAALCSEHIPIAAFTPHLEYLVESVYRAQNDGQTTKGLDGSDPTKEMADECMQLIEAQVESAAFFRAYSAVQQRWTQKRQETKRMRALETVVDGEASAKRKIEKNLAKKKNRKRKADRVKLAHRGVGPTKKRTSSE